MSRRKFDPRFFPSHCVNPVFNYFHPKLSLPLSQLTTFSVLNSCQDNTLTHTNTHPCAHTLFLLLPRTIYLSHALSPSLSQLSAIPKISDRSPIQASVTSLSVPSNLSQSEIVSSDLPTSSGVQLA